MKKFLRFLIIFLVIGLAVMFSLALYEPQDTVVKRTTIIKAPKEAVFEQMVKFKNWTNWSPWYLMDTAMRLTYTGTDGLPGSAYQWKGDDNKTGSGEMRDISIDGTAMNFAIIFTSPREGTATSLLKAKDTAGEQTKATWSMTMHTAFPYNAMCAFINMDKLLGGDLETGLANMKKYVESHTSPAAVIDIKEVDFAAHTYEGIRQTVAMSDISKFFMDSYTALGKESALKVTGAATGLFFTWDTVLKKSDMAAVFPVTDTIKLAVGAVILHAGPAKAWMAVLKGGYGTEMLYHAAIAKRIADKGQKQSLVVEEYIVGPHEQADSNKWVTNIYYLVQ
jgi:hypothetical protein